MSEIRRKKSVWSLLSGSDLEYFAVMTEKAPELYSVSSSPVHVTLETQKRSSTARFWSPQSFGSAFIPFFDANNFRRLSQVKPLFVESAMDLSSSEQ